jgi:hypothetical protein
VNTNTYGGGPNKMGFLNINFDKISTLSRFLFDINFGFVRVYLKHCAGLRYVGAVWH